MRRRHLRVAISTCCALAAATAWAPARAAGVTPSTRPSAATAVQPVGDFSASVTPLLTKYCYECHGDGNSSGKLALDRYKSDEDMRKAKATWQKVIRYTRSQTMPPPDADQPNQADRERLVAAMEKHLYNIDPAHPDPGRVTIRRLSQVEYRNTVRDLIGVDFDPTIDFPQDDTGYGFDNIADVLTLPPMLMEKYLAAADKVLNQAIPTESVQSRERHIAAPVAERVSGKEKSADGWVTLSSRDEDALAVPVQVVAPAEYTFRVLAYAKTARAPATTRATTAPGAPHPVKLSFMVGDTVVSDVEVTADENHPQWYEARVSAGAGKRTFRVAVRRQRGPAFDTVVSGGRVGPEQAGAVRVKELVVNGPVQGAVRRREADQIQTSGSANRGGDSIFIGSNDGEASTTFDVHADREYVLRVHAAGTFVDEQPAKMELRVDGKPVKVFEVAAPAQFQPAGDHQDLSDRARRAVPQAYEVRVPLKAGTARVSVRLLNDAYHPENPNPNYRDRNVVLQAIELSDPSAPPLAPPMSGPMRKLFVQHGGAAAGQTDGRVANDTSAARAILADFARHAWRRPVQPTEVDRLARLYDLARSNGESFHGSVRHAMKAVLVSPRFLFRGQPPVNDPAGAHPIDEYELASRLSYFLWSTTPDDELLDLADRGELRKKLDAQVARMLASPKAGALSENFAGQWLQFRNLDAAQPDDRLFKPYDGRLRDAMKKETQLFFESLVKDDRSVLDLLTADYTFVNERLARHYGLSGVKGEQFRRVSLADTPRRGVITQGSVLTLTSNPTRTSPVKRGKWVLENLLGAEPPPPPPDTPPLPGDGRAHAAGTLRQRLEKHREDVNCASCHAPMDPIGFGLENFDGIGAWRDKDGGDPIDPASEMPDGTKFKGAVELTKFIATTRRNDFLRATTEHMMTYAIGRGVEPTDSPAVARIVEAMKKDDFKIGTLIRAIIDSPPFQMRRGGTDNASAEATAR